jgi:pentatricopeptide repeat protein
LEETETLAELYVRQGLVGKARQIFRRLAEQGHAKARQRLAELPSAEREIELLNQLLERVRERRGIQGRS